MSRKEDAFVSVIIPTYLRPDSLKRALDCVLAQTHKNLEIIVVDDNHPDSGERRLTEEIMKPYMANPKVRYLQNERNLGGAGARNVGIDAARGEYIAFLDDDDEYYPAKIEKQLDVFLNSGSQQLALVYCDVEQAGEGGRIDCVLRRRFKGNCLYKAILTDCIAPTSLWLVRKSALVSVGGFSIVPCKQDSTVILKLLEHGYELDYVPEILCRYNDWTGGVRISFNSRKIEGERLYMDTCRRNFAKFSPRQVKEIEFSFASRLYVLYSYTKAYKDKKREELFRMMGLKPLSAVRFSAWHELRRLKRKVLS